MEANEDSDSEIKVERLPHKSHALYEDYRHVVLYLVKHFFLLVFVSLGYINGENFMVSTPYVSHSWGNSS